MSAISRLVLIDFLFRNTRFEPATNEVRDANHGHSASEPKVEQKFKNHSKRTQKVNHKYLNDQELKQQTDTSTSKGLATLGSLSIQSEASETPESSTQIATHKSGASAELSSGVATKSNNNFPISDSIGGRKFRSISVVKGGRGRRQSGDLTTNRDSLSSQRDEAKMGLDKRTEFELEQEQMPFQQQQRHSRQANQNTSQIQRLLYYDNNNKLTNAPASRNTTKTTATTTTTTTNRRTQTKSPNSGRKHKYQECDSELSNLKLVTLKQSQVPTRSQSKHQLQFEQQTRQEHQQHQLNRQANHHYDYSSDFYLQNSMVTATNEAANHYGENILLFATEHEPRQSAARRQQLNRQPSDGYKMTQRPIAGRNQQSPSNSSFSHSEPRKSMQTRNHLPKYGQTGRFISLYPSSRQMQSPASLGSSGHRLNHSFHVPLNLQRRQASNANHHHHQQQQQPRYGFVVAPSRVSASGTSSADLIGDYNTHTKSTNSMLCHSAFKSQTIAHIPDMLKVSTDLDIGHKNSLQRLGEHKFHDHLVARYETLEPVELKSTNQLVKSEGDLLKAHVVRVVGADGHDNPFRPGTELSWEADMMVRLMKRGYPVDELPILVETAKRVLVDREVCNGNQNEPMNLTTSNRGSWRQQLEENIYSNYILDDFNDQSPKRSSNLDLHSGKQIWANSLSRTKSMPRFHSNGSNYDLSNGNASKSLDSLDKLILSIENEMSALSAREGDCDENEASKSDLHPKEKNNSKILAITKATKPKTDANNRSGSKSTRLSGSNRKQLAGDNGAKCNLNVLNADGTPSVTNGKSSNKALAKKNAKCCLLQ